MTEKERITEAIVWHINYRLDDTVEMYIIDGKLGLVGVQHENNADLSFLQKIGIKIPPYHEEKHWFRDKSDFSLFLTDEIYKKVREDYAKHKHTEKIILNEQKQ